MEKFIYKKWFKILLVLVMFCPLITEQKYNPQYTTNVIGSVLEHPYINNIGVGLIITKIILLVVCLLPLLMKEKSCKYILGYYGVILLFVGLFQNMSNTEYGFTFIIGNMIVQYIVSICCFNDVIKSKSKISKEDLNKKALWIIPLMILAFLMPYIIENNKIIPSISTIFTNEAGVTYCMITPVIIGMLILFSKNIDKATINIISFVGLSFGIFNMMTWFGFNIKDWWMGILHLPLLIISIYGLRISKIKKGRDINEG